MFLEMILASAVNVLWIAASHSAVQATLGWLGRSFLRWPNFSQAARAEVLKSRSLRRRMPVFHLLSTSLVAC